MDDFGNLDFLDLISIFSFVIGVENLRINIAQSNQLDQHLSLQDEKMLAKIIQQNEKIIQLLEQKNDRT